MLRKIASEYTVPIKIKNRYLHVKHAISTEDLAKGLMGVKELSPFHGCLLDFGSSRPIGLWMKNCHIDLDALVLDERGKIIDILKMSHANPYQSHRSYGRYALEVTPAVTKDLKLKIGDCVLFLDKS